MKLPALVFLVSFGVVAAAMGYEPTSNYTVREIEGWKVYVNNALLDKGEHAELGAKALEKLHADLAAVKTWIPDRPLEELLEAPIWLEVDTTNGPHGRTPTFHYHPGKDWLEKMDFHPGKHQCVEFSRAEAYVRAGERSVSITLHELAHAYHDRVLGFDDPEILAAYKRAVAGTAYPPRDWARSNHKEFFCAVTQRYFGRKEEREQLRERDPEVVEILAKVWGAPKSFPDDPPAKGQEKSAKEKSKEPAPQRVFQPTANYAVKNLEGWKVYVDKRLLGEEKEVGAAALKRVQSMLYDVCRVVPGRAVKELRKTAIWLEMDNDWHAPCACYHGSEGWLRSAGMNDYYPFVRAELMHHDPAAYELMREIWGVEAEEPIDYRKNALKVAGVPPSLRESLRLDPLYTKYVSARGFPVVAAAKVSDYALLEAAYLINQLLLDRPDVLGALVRRKVRFVVIPVDDMTTDVPEHRELKPAEFWDRRARGLGPSPSCPVVSCGEENLLRYPGDPYHTESILVHEFAHAMHGMGLNSVDKRFEARLKTTFEKAVQQGLWKGAYAAKSFGEYWAEGVQSYFDTNRENDHDHNHVDTREELLEYDPDLAALIAREFRNATWRYRRADDRNYTGHLQGYDPENAPRFAWPARLFDKDDQGKPEPEAGEDPDDKQDATPRRGAEDEAKSGK